MLIKCCGSKAAAKKLKILLKVTVVSGRTAVLRSFTKGSGMACSEVKVPVPWGHISGKEWGEGSEVWILTHGWLDNCGSFDPLIRNHFPLQQHKLIAIDVPGHGYSSHYPLGFHYHYMDGIQYIKRVANHYNLTTFNLLGHSMGAGISLMYAATYPEQVKRLVQLDGLKPISRHNLDTIVDKTRSHFDSLIQLETKPERVHTYEEAFERQRIGSEQISGPLTQEALETLAARSIRKVTREDGNGEGYVFNRDIRHRINSLYAMETHVINEYLKRVRCPHLCIKARDRKHYESNNAWEDAAELCRKTNPGFVHHEVEGRHHVHLTNPERVWPVISDFLDKVKSNI